MRIKPLLFLLWLCVAQVHASPQFSKCSSLLRALENPVHDTSVELELRNTDAILDLLTTLDGSLAPLLPARPADPSSALALPESLHKDFGEICYDTLAATAWDTLTTPQKRAFLAWVTERKSSSFFSDRNLPGIKMKEKANVTFKTPQEFLGKPYSAGEHVIDISHLFKNVEYGSPNQNPEFLELHFRTNRPAGEVSNSAWVLLSGLDQRKIHQHVHVVSPLDISKLQSEGEVRSLMYSEYFRRANLALEMMKVVDELHAGISANKTEKVIFFDSLDTDKLLSVHKHFENTRLYGRQLPLGSLTKMAYIGFRGADTYDSSSLIGFEVRAISQFANPNYIRDFLNSVQWTLSQENFGIPKEDLQTWLDTYKTSSQIDPNLLYYNKPWETLSKTDLGERFIGIDPYLRKHFYDLEKNREIKMLIHDWSKDPLLFKKPKLVEHIKREQLKAIVRLNSGEESVWRIVSEFLKRSGLYATFTKSIGN